MIKTWAHIVDYMGTPFIFFTLSGFMVFFFFRKNLFEEALLFTVTFLTTVSLIGLLKIIFRVCRPKDAKIKLRSYSFPSGHATSSTFFVLTSTLLLKGNVPDTIVYFFASIGILTVIIISISRITLKVHTPFEVVFGVVLGLIIPLSMFLYF